MNREKWNPWLQYCLAAVIFALLSIVISQILLRCLYLFLGFDPTFSDIFRQIRWAPMTSPPLWTSLAGFTGGWMYWKLWSRKHRTSAVIIGVLWLLLMTLGGFLLTKVNGILFIDVLRSLLPLLESGVL